MANWAGETLISNCSGKSIGINATGLDDVGEVKPQKDWQLISPVNQEVEFPFIFQELLFFSWINGNHTGFFLLLFFSSRWYQLDSNTYEEDTNVLIGKCCKLSSFQTTPGDN